MHCLTAKLGLADRSALNTDKGGTDNSAVPQQLGLTAKLGGLGNEARPAAATAERTGLSPGQCTTGLTVKMGLAGLLQAHLLSSDTCSHKCEVRL